MSHCSPTTSPSAGLIMELSESRIYSSCTVLPTFHTGREDSRGRSYDSLTPEHDPVLAPFVPSVRKSHDRKRPEGHIPRPPNAFLLYRSDFLRKSIIPRNVESKQYNISIVVGECWRRLTREEREVWLTLAREKEEEHARMYPDYKYTPKKREHVHKRRKALTREEEVDHCEALRTTYLPDKTGPVIQPPVSTPRRKRKSRAKVCAVPKVLPPVESPVSVPTPSFDAPAFTDLPRPPAPQSQAPDSAWQKQSQEVTWTSHAVLDPVLEPMIYFDFPAALSPDNEMETDDLWSPDPVLQSPLPEPIPIPTCEPVPINAAIHIREKYNIARRGAIFPTPSMDSLEARAIFEHQPFFAPSASSEGAYPATPEAQDSISSPSDVWSNFTFPQFDYAPSPSYHASNTLPLQSDMPLPSVPQHFPMSLEVSGTMEPLRLQPPTFRSPIETHSLDSLTVSLDYTKLDRLEGVDGLLDLFSEIDELGLGGESGLGPMEDLLTTDICSRED